VRWGAFRFVTSSPKDARRGQGRRRFLDEPRLADARLARDEHDPAVPVARSAEVRFEGRALGGSTDEGSIGEGGRQHGSFV